MNYLSLLLILLLLASCGSSIATSPRRSSDISKKIMENNDRLLAHNGFCEVLGEQANGFKRGKIEKQYVTKERRFKTIAEVRAFFCKFMEDFLRPLNQEARIRPYLENYPLSWKDMNLTIAFFDDEDAPLSTPYFAAVSNIDDYIYYEHYDPENGEYLTDAVEPMDRAFRIYHSHRQEK